MRQQSSDKVIKGIERYVNEELPYLTEEEMPLATEIAVARISIELDGLMLERPQFSEFYSEIKKTITSLFMAISDYEKGNRYEAQDHVFNAKRALTRLAIKESDFSSFQALRRCIQEALTVVGTSEDNGYSRYALFLASQILLDGDTFNSYFEDSKSDKDDGMQSLSLEISVGGKNREDLKQEEERARKLKEEQEKRRKQLLEADRSVFEQIKRMHDEYVHSIRHDIGIGR